MLDACSRSLRLQSRKTKRRSRESGDTKITRSEVSMLLRKQNMGLPKKVFKDNRLAIKGVEPTKKDVEKLAKDIKKAFATPTHNKGRIGVAVRGFNRFLKQNTRMLNELFGKMGRVMRDLYKGENKESDPEFQKKLREIAESNPEIKTTSKLLAANWTQSTIIPKSRLSQAWVRKLVLDLLSRRKQPRGWGSINSNRSYLGSLAGSVAVASLVTGFVFKKIVKKVNQVKGKDQGVSLLLTIIWLPTSMQVTLPQSPSTRNTALS